MEADSQSSQHCKSSQRGPHPLTRFQRAQQLKAEPEPVVLVLSSREVEEIKSEGQALLPDAYRVVDSNVNTHNSPARLPEGPWLKTYGIKINRKPIEPNESLAFEEVVVKSKFNGPPIKKVVPVITILDDDKDGPKSLLSGTNTNNHQQDNESQDEEESTVNIVIRGTSSIRAPPPSLQEPDHISRK